MAARYYSAHATALRADLARSLPRDVMRALHTKSVFRHALVAARQFAMLAFATLGLVRLTRPIYWIPLAVVQGFTVFNFTVLLHEVVHRAVFPRHRPAADGVLAWLYAVPSGISPTQFSRWHLDHHAALGSPVEDPKRHHLSPKLNARWLKLLYCTPALFFLYFRAARREAESYPPEVRAAIRRERRVAMVVHLGALAALAWTAGLTAALRAYVIPVFFVFPVAFTLNRLGQHYDIDPTDPAKWATLVKGSIAWDFVFLNSNYHLEHHYFPGVPFYHLPALQRALAPFYARHAVRSRHYSGLIWDWIVRNRAPHTDWAELP